jgi:HTH-type transcriptional regulator / antitoxin HigA
MKFIGRVEAASFLRQHPDQAETVRAWLGEIQHRKWGSPEALLADYPTIDITRPPLAVFWLDRIALQIETVMAFSNGTVFLTGFRKPDEPVTITSLDMEMRRFTIRPIRTPEDLLEAKARLGDLLKSNKDGAYDDEIEVLSTLVEQFEKTKVPIDAPSPMAAIRFRMEEIGISARQLEPFIGSRARVSEVLSGKRQLSIDMIRSLHEGLGIPYESLISKRSRSNSVEDVPAPAIDRLNALGFDVGRNQISAFVSPLVQYGSSSALLRRSRTQRTASKMDQAALLLWQAAVLKKSEGRKTRRVFDRLTFNPQKLRMIARLSTKRHGPRYAIEILEELGIIVAIIPLLPGTFLDGAAMAGPDRNPVIGLTLRHDRVDSFWFTLLHELSHVTLHYDQLMERDTAFVDDMEILSEDSNEREADQLARDSLIPIHILSQIRWGNQTSHDDIVALAVRSRVHVAIAAGRWQRDHQNYKKFARLIERGTIRSTLGVS